LTHLHERQLLIQVCLLLCQLVCQLLLHVHPQRLPAAGRLGPAAAEVQGTTTGGVLRWGALIHICNLLAPEGTKYSWGSESGFLNPTLAPQHTNTDNMSIVVSAMTLCG
jgi:hypothetical protein